MPEQIVNSSQEKTETPLKSEEEINKEMDIQGEGEPQFEEGVGKKTEKIKEEEKKEEENKDEKKEEENLLQKEIDEKNKQITESQKEALRLNKENKEKDKAISELQNNLTKAGDFLTWQQRNTEVGIYNEHLNSHKDFYSEKDKEDLQNILDAASDEEREGIFSSNPRLKKLNDEFSSLTPKNSSNPLADLKNRMDKAFQIAFFDEIIEKRTKQTQVKTELEIQEGQKIAEQGGKGKGIKTSSLTSEQIELGRKMGLTQDQMEKNL